jgi:RNA polymerase sigma-70 factor (ECF subfamily)
MSGIGVGRSRGRRPNASPPGVVRRSAGRTEAHAAARDGVVDDTDLIAGARAGDRLAARRLYDRHAPRVYRLIFRIVGEDSLAQEYTQDTFVKAFDRLGQYRGESAFSTWLHSVAMSSVLTGFRRRKRFRSREAELEEASGVATPPDGSDPYLRDRLTAELERLPERLRMPVVLHDIEGFTHREIGEMLDIPQGTSKARLFEARARLREALAGVATEQ